MPIQRELPPGKRRKTFIEYRGNFLDRGPEVSEGVPAAFHPLPKDMPVNRLALAKWLVDRDNPLTARVLVNRLWEKIFGIGLVATSEDFGTQGDMPSHPGIVGLSGDGVGGVGLGHEALIRLMVMSAAYRQSSRVTPELQERDPDNRLLARGPRFRLDAEAIRDQSLAVSGLLSAKMFGPAVRPLQPSFGLVGGLRRFDGLANERGRGPLSPRDLYGLAADESLSLDGPPSIRPAAKSAPCAARGRTRRYRPW